MAEARLLAVELKTGILVGGTDASAVPEAAHETINRLLVLGHVGFGAVTALARVGKRGL